MAGLAGEEAAAAQDRVVAAQPHHRAGELEERLLVLAEVPVDPRDLVVLAVGVVVALLGAAELVAVADHRHALAEQDRGEEVADLAVAQREDPAVLRRALGAAVPGAVVVVTVVVALAVGLVVLLVVRDEVVEGEAVVRGNEVDRGDWRASGVLVEVRGARDAGGELAQRRGLAAPEVAHRVAVLPVPLAPQGREAADLVAALADVPGLGDELDLGEHRVLVDDVEEGGELVHLGELAGQGRGEVEAEAVDVHLRDPVAQRVHDELEDGRGAHEQGVARARRVEVVLLVAVDEPVVGGVVQALEGQRRAHVVALGGVVVDDVEDDLDVGLVEGLDHRLELGDLLAVRPVGGVGALRGEEADRVVAPVVRQPLLLEVGVVDELVDRHELDGGDAEVLEVVDDDRLGEARVGAAQVLRHLGVEPGEALDVGLVDDRVVVLVGRRAVVAPVEEGGRHH